MSASGPRRATAGGCAIGRVVDPELNLYGVEGLTVAVMGCIVNGPGESKHADIGISLPGTGEQPTAPVFVDGKKAATLRGPTLTADFKAMVLDYIERRFGGSAGRTAAE